VPCFPGCESPDLIGWLKDFPRKFFVLESRESLVVVRLACMARKKLEFIFEILQFNCGQTPPGCHVVVVANNGTPNQTKRK
jgi:hypothetical protein